MAFILTRLDVGDYDRWKPMFDKDEPGARSTARNHRILRNTENPGRGVHRDRVRLDRGRAGRTGATARIRRARSLRRQGSSEDRRGGRGVPLLSSGRSGQELDEISDERDPQSPARACRGASRQSGRLPPPPARAFRRDRGRTRPCEARRREAPRPGGPRQTMEIHGEQLQPADTGKPMWWIRVGCINLLRAWLGRSMR